MHFLEVRDFLTAAKTHSLYDLRPLHNFKKAHLPGAQSMTFPIDVKALQQEFHDALPPISTIEKYVKNLHELKNVVQTSLQHSRTLLFYCQAGGLRSYYFQHLFSEFSNDFRFLAGGYQAFEVHREALWQQPMRWVVLGGKTGSGKTRLLHILAERGEQIIDLEGLARHRGSVFGGGDPAGQPTSSQFHNDLLAVWSRLDPDRPVFIEHKGKHLGSLALPPAVQNSLQRASCLYLDLPLSMRIRYILQDYRHLSEQDFRAGILRLSERLGRKVTLHALHALESGEREEMIALLLEYYDKSLRYQPNGVRLSPENLNWESIASEVQKRGKI